MTPGSTGCGTSWSAARCDAFPAGIIPVPEAHLGKHTNRDDDALLFTGIKGRPLRRNGFNKLTRWVDVVRTTGVPGLHFHDLRHTGNTIVADMGVSLRNLMAQMGHDNERTALIYQHASNKSDRKIADSLDASVGAAQPADDKGDDEDGAAGKLMPVA